MYIHFSNLSSKVTQSEIYDLLKVFASVGYCAICHIKHINTTSPDTYAIVDMTNMSEIEKAVELLDGTMLGGHKITARIGG